jgi:hypothetical protein
VFGNEFTCKDRNDVAVYCSRECWTKHICIHAETRGQQKLVQVAIRTPSSEYQDPHHADTRNLYKSLVLPIIGNTLLKVSIQYIKQFGTVRGFVKTAYATDKVKKGEIWLWGQKY